MSTPALRPGTVSVIVPCRNEAGHVDAFLASAFAQWLPPGWTLEIVVADGQSDDGTRARLAGWERDEPRLRVVDNPARITSAALNRALEQATGSVVVRMDVHTVYAEDYVAACIAALQHSGATCVGGAWRPVGTAGRQRAIARAFASPFASGGAAVLDQGGEQLGVVGAAREARAQGGEGGLRLADALLGEAAD